MKLMAVLGSLSVASAGTVAAVLVVMDVQDDEPLYWVEGEGFRRGGVEQCYDKLEGAVACEQEITMRPKPRPCVPLPSCLRPPARYAGPPIVFVPDDPDIRTPFTPVRDIPTSYSTPVFPVIPPVTKVPPTDPEIPPIPLPASVWLLIGALASLFAFRRFRKIQ